MRNPEFATTIANTITKLHQEFPEYTIGMHIITALDGEELYTIPDKDLAETLINYVSDLTLNNED